MLTTIEVTIDKTGYLHPVESNQSIKPGRALLTWLEPDITHEPSRLWRKTGSIPRRMRHGHTCSRANRRTAFPVFRPQPEKATPSLTAGRSAGGSPAAGYFLLPRQKKVTKVKATPVSRRFAVPCVARLFRRLRNSHCVLRQSSPKSPDQSALLGGAQGLPESQPSKKLFKHEGLIGQVAVYWQEII
jgi:hypothetical protein